MIVEDDDDDSSPILTSLIVFTPDIFDVFPLLGNECLVVGSNVITLAAISDVIIVCWKYCSGGPGPAPVWGTHKVALMTLIVTL